MSVKLVGITKPVIEGVATAEELVSFIARVSNPTNQLNHGTASKLLQYLIRNAHWSPFEMVNLVLEIETTRDIGRQILRHHAKFNEFSQRYSVVDDSWFLKRQARLQDTKNRQNSLEFEDEEIHDWWDDSQNVILETATNIYKSALEKGIAKEQARAVLPEGMTMSRMYMNYDLRGWMHYAKLRCENGTQKEHQEIAKLVKAIVIEQFPSLEEYLNMPNIHDAVVKAFEHYRSLLLAKNIKPIDMSAGNEPISKMLPHALFMVESALPKIKAHAFSDDKANRWLGFVQAILIFNGLTTIDNERNVTRPWFTGKE